MVILNRHRRDIKAGLRPSTKTSSRYRVKAQPHRASQPALCLSSWCSCYSNAAGVEVTAAKYTRKEIKWAKWSQNLLSFGHTRGFCGKWKQNKHKHKRKVASPHSSKITMMGGKETCWFYSCLTFLITLLRSNSHTLQPEMLRLLLRLWGMSKVTWDNRGLARLSLSLSLLSLWSCLPPSVSLH